MLFTADIIDGTKFRRLKKYRYALYFVLIFMYGVLVRPRTMTGIYPGLRERFGIDSGSYLILFLLMGLLTLALVYFSNRVKVLGRIVITATSIQIKRGGITEGYFFTDISDWVIERGATYHYEYQKRNSIIQVDNWIHFKTGGKVEKFEFKIESAAHNVEFEQMIEYLRKYRVAFTFLSI